MNTLLNAAIKLLFVSAAIWGIYQLDGDGRTLDKIVVCLSDLKNSMSGLKTEMANLARRQDQSENAIARLQGQ